MSLFGDKNKNKPGGPPPNKPPMDKPALGSGTSSKGFGGMVRKPASTSPGTPTRTEPTQAYDPQDSSTWDYDDSPSTSATSRARPPAKTMEKHVIGEFEGDPEAELSRVTEALQANPQDEPMHMRRYEIVKKYGERKDLFMVLEEAFTLCPKAFFGVKLAALHEEDDHYAMAIPYREQVAKLAPDDPDSWKRLAHACVKANDFAPAERAYDKLIVLRANDENPLGTNFLDEMTGTGLPAAERTGLQSLGLRVVEKALAKRGDSVHLLEFAARLSARANQLDKAMKHYEQLIEKNAENSNLRTWKTELLRLYGRAGLPEKWQTLSNTLIRDYTRHLDKNPRDGRAWLLLGRQHVLAGQTDEAVRALKNAQACDSQDWQAVYELGKLLIKLGRSEEAIHFYEDILDPFQSGGPERKSIRRALEKSLADLYFRMGRYNESLGIYSRDEEANTRYIAPLYEAVNERDKARELYQKTIKQTPVDAEAHLRMAEFFVRQGNWTEAEASARQGLSCKNAYGEVLEGLYVVLATALMHQKRSEEALATMDRAVSDTPDSATMLFRKVKLLHLCGRQAEGRDLADQVSAMIQRQIACAPAASGLWSLMGDCSSLLSRFPEAEQAYSSALQYDQMDATAWRGLGVLYEKKQDVAGAIDCFKKFVLLDPINLATHPIQQKIKELEAQLVPTPQAGPVT